MTVLTTEHLLIWLAKHIAAVWVGFEILTARLPMFALGHHGT
ncbi:hypothetical protein ABH973_000680 [Bradyrhizobium ottawaense]